MALLLPFLSNIHTLIKNPGLALSAVEQRVPHLQDYEKFPPGVSKSCASYFVLQII